MAMTPEQKETIEAAQVLLAEKIHAWLEDLKPEHVGQASPTLLRMAEALAWCKDPSQSHGGGPNGPKV